MLNLKIVLFIGYFTLSMMVFSSEKIVLAYADHESYPYQMGESSEVLNPPGLAVEIILKAAKDIGVEIELVRYPGKRVLKYIEVGEVDGGFIFSYNKERAKYGAYPMLNDKLAKEKRVASLSYYLYKLKKSSVQWDGKEIKVGEEEGVKSGFVGVRPGFSIMSYLEELNLKVIEKKKLSDLFNLLEKERVIAVASQGVVADNLLKVNNVTGVKRVEPPLKTKDYFLIFNKNYKNKNEFIVEKLWNQIEIVRDEVIEAEGWKYTE